ncbi:MAG TPA: cobalamin-independent methionine synthase II family protein, partial [Chloroflexota bacterium]
TDHILTSHTGSLPRPDPLRRLLDDKDQDRPYDVDALRASVRASVAAVVRKQADTGLSVINDGEHSKYSFWRYLKDRLTGFEYVAGAGTYFDATAGKLDELDFPNFFATRPNVDFFVRTRSAPLTRLSCEGPITWRDFESVEDDIATLQAASRGVPHADLFMTSTSPGNIFNLIPNHHYASDDEYMQALADALRREYRAIVNAGIVLQLDAPDLASRSLGDPSRYSLERFRAEIARSIEALNYATADLPPDMVRVHVCWGSDERPHHRDNELKDIVDLLLTLRPNGLTIVAANARHAFEWRVWEEVKLPEGKVLMPGVIDSTTNIIEHPETVAERIERFASVIGKENMIAGVDCGFQMNAGRDAIDPDVAWAKLAALADGAARASRRLWGRVAVSA